MYHFGGPKSWDRGTPPPSLENCPNFGPTFPVSLLGGPPGGPITLWIDEILPPHLCSVCFITFMDSCKANLVLGNFAKKLGFGQTPPPGWSKRPTFPIFFWRLPLLYWCWWQILFWLVCMQCGLMCGIWDWQSTIVGDLNDSQDPKHTLFCRENAFVAIYALFQTTNVPFLPV